MLVKYILKSVFKINKTILAIISHAIFRVVCIQFTHFSYDECEHTCILYFYHHQIGSMTHLASFKARSWNALCALYAYECISGYIQFFTRLYIVSTAYKMINNHILNWYQSNITWASLRLSSPETGPCVVLILYDGHSRPGGICPESDPLSLTCSFTTMLGTLLIIDT